MPTFDMKEYARRGAQARVAELQQELEAIYGAFPELRSGGRQQRSTSTAATNGLAERPSSGARRRPSRMTATQRKAVSERMRKYWAARRAERAKGAGKKTKRVSG